MSLRLRIVLLVLLATLTPAALLGTYLVEHRRNDIGQATRNLDALARYAAGDLGDKVSGTVQLLHGLSRAADLDAADQGVCSTFLHDVLGRYPQYTGLLTIRPDGQLHCDSLRSGRTLELADRAYFRQARDSGAPAIEAAFGRLTGIAVLQVAYPARDQQGVLRFVLLASLNLAQFAAQVATASPHPGMVVLIWDDKGTLMLRVPDDGPRKLAGTAQADSTLYRYVQSAPAGATAELPGPDGTVRFWAHSVLPVASGAGLRIAVGIPRAVLFEEADALLRQALILLASVSLLVFIGALLLAELGIRRPIARIAAAAAGQGGGDFSVRIGQPYPRGELGGLMATLDATAASVQAQQAEIGRQAEELRGTNRTLRMLSAINSTIVREHDRGCLLAEACRIATEEGQFPIAWAGLLERGTMQVEPVAWAGVTREYVESLPRAAADPANVIGQVFRDRRAVVVNDIAAAPRLVMGKTALALGSRSFASFPLFVSGAVAGVFVLHAPVADFFDAQEMQLLGELAGDVSFALEFIEKSEKLEYLAYHDALTGLPNRTLFHERLSQVLDSAVHDGHNLTVVVADIERFRRINDTFGRPAGDELLRQIADRGRRTLPNPLWLARIGSDHFAYMITDLSDPGDIARRVLQAHQALFDQSFRLEETDVRVAARFGIAVVSTNGADADTLIANAEAALGKAKAGGERYMFHVPQMTEWAVEKLALENLLRRALEKGEFVLRYQPKVDLKTRRLAGVEALLYWQSPELGLMPRLKFVPLLEETGLILQVGAWALRQAATDHRAWREAGLNPPRLAVDISPVQLRQRDFVQVVGRAVAAGGTPPGIDLEITESELIEDIEGYILKLEEVRALGIGLAIDNFGTGHSSLANLARLPVQALKIDRVFIKAMLNDPQTMTMVSTIISLAHSLRLTVIADGVDTEDQAKMLRLLRCDQMQGRVFSRSVPQEELLQLLRQER
ncbi:MAG: EAL domain-containing protein [Betaproteobacteria bacterium]|nr:EAL domain-containing protein [Betaproteobacteria bacterium]